MRDILIHKFLIIIMYLTPLVIFSQTTNMQYEGFWYSREYGESIEIIGDSVTIFQVNNDELLKRQYTKGVITNNTLNLLSEGNPFGSVTNYKISLADDILVLVEDHTDAVYYFEKLSEIPKVLSRTNNPILNLNYFWNMHYERYPYFSERKINWNMARTLIDSLSQTSINSDSLFNHFKNLVNFFKNDGHIWIAREKEETFEFYTPLHRNPTQSIKSKKELMFLIGEKYLDQHQYNTTANGKIIYKYLPDSIGYIFISSFYQMSNEKIKVSQVESLRRDLDSLYSHFMNAKGLIIDVRYNGGGNDWAALTCAGLFISNGNPIISKRSRIQATNNFSLPQISRSSILRNCFSDIPIVVLSSKFSVSATETFLIAMKSVPNVMSMGEPSKGMLSDSYVFELPNGWFFGVYSDKVYSFDGKVFENKGVPVNREIKMEIDDFNKGFDTVLEEALSYFKN